MKDQEEINAQYLSENPEKRIKALDQLTNFSQLSDKRQACSDLIRLIINQNNDMKSRASQTLITIFPDVPDKQKICNDLIRLINDQDRNVRTCAAETLTTIFSDVPDKQQAYNDLIRLLTDQDDEVKSWPAKVLMDVFSDVPDKQQAYNDLIRLITDQNRKVRTYASYILKTIFSDVPDKQQAYNDLIRLLTDQNDEVKAWPAKVLMDVFSDVPDKQQAYYDLIRLITDQDRNVRTYAAETLTTIFSDVPDKQQAYNDLIRLLTDQDDEVKVWPAKVLMDVFSDVPDKQQAYNDLIRLLTDQDDNVKYWAFQILRYIYSDLPDKQQPWNELIKFAADESNDLRPTAVWVLSYMVSQVPDQQQAWNDLIKLTSDRSSLVCLRANYALGKVSIFKASRAENEESYKEKLENAISFFEKASKQSSNEFENPAQFCLPFYRSFHSIIFRRQEAKEEVGKYLTEAKDAIKGSKSKETLFEAVENLANALKTVQKLENLDFEAKKDELNFYRKYCDRAAELMKDAEETAPFATITLQKGLPILNKNLKELLEEIQKKAKIACKESVGTPEAEIACTINKEVQKWEISSPEKMTQNIEDLTYALKNLVSDFPENEYILNKIDLMRIEKDFTEKFQILSYIIGQIPKEHKVSIEVHGNENNFIVNSNGSNISTSKDTAQPPSSSTILKLILEHPIISGIIATVVGSIIFTIIQKKYLL